MWTFNRLFARALLIFSITYFARGCYLENRDIQIENIRLPKDWTYNIVTIPLGERMYYVLIDGELDQDAELELQIQKTTSNRTKPDTTFTNINRLKLPKGKFSMYYNRDDSGPEAFTYKPLNATKGWVRIQIRPGQWSSKDSSRTECDYHGASSIIKEIRSPSVNHTIFYRPYTRDPSL